MANTEKKPEDMTPEEKAQVLDDLGILEFSEGRKMAAALTMLEILDNDPGKAAAIALMLQTFLDIANNKREDVGCDLAFPMLTAALEVAIQICATICANSEEWEPVINTADGGEVV